MIVKNTFEDIIIYISVSGVSREIIIHFSRKETRMKFFQGLKEIGEISIEDGKSYIFEEIEYDPSLQDYITSRCEEYGLENIINMHDCTLTTTLLEIFIEIERKRINRE